MVDHLVFTSKYNGAILSRYNSLEHIGLCLFEISDFLKSQIKTMMDLSILSSDFIDNYICVESRINDFKCVVFVPMLDVEYLSRDKEFLNSFSNNVNIWAVKGFDPEQYNKELVVPVEIAYLRVSRECVQINFICLENKILNGLVFSASISHSAIGL